MACRNTEEINVNTALIVHGTRDGRYLQQLDADGLVEGVHQTRSDHSLAGARTLQTVVSYSSSIDCDFSLATHQVVKDGVLWQ